MPGLPVSFLDLSSKKSPKYEKAPRPLKEAGRGYNVVSRKEEFLASAGCLSSDPQLTNRLYYSPPGRSSKKKAPHPKTRGFDGTAARSVCDDVKLHSRNS
jgi:hypothetical protein